MFDAVRMCGRWISKAILERITARTEAADPPLPKKLVQEFCRCTQWRNRIVFRLKRLVRVFAGKDESPLPLMRSISRLKIRPHSLGIFVPLPDFQNFHFPKAAQYWVARIG